MAELLTLAQAGPAAILLVGIVVLARVVMTGSFVPGYLYRQERADRERAEGRVIELTKTIADLAKVAANGTPDAGAPHGR